MYVTPTGSLNHTRIPPPPPSFPLPLRRNAESRGHGRFSDPASTEEEGDLFLFATVGERKGNPNLNKFNILRLTYFRVQKHATLATPPSFVLTVKKKLTELSLPSYRHATIPRSQKKNKKGKNVETRQTRRLPHDPTALPREHESSPRYYVLAVVVPSRPAEHR